MGRVVLLSLLYGVVFRDSTLTVCTRAKSLHLYADKKARFGGLQGCEMEESSPLVKNVPLEHERFWRNVRLQPDKNIEKRVFFARFWSFLGPFLARIRGCFGCASIREERALPGWPVVPGLSIKNWDVGPTEIQICRSAVHFGERWATFGE
jgi:hypothetical protein